MKLTLAVYSLHKNNIFFIVLFDLKITNNINSLADTKKQIKQTSVYVQPKGPV
jgi:hypothetical protein